jgi:hypothetical protein
MTLVTLMLHSANTIGLQLGLTSNQGTMEIGTLVSIF